MTSNLNVESGGRFKQFIIQQKFSLPVNKITNISPAFVGLVMLDTTTLSLYYSNGVSWIQIFSGNNNLIFNKPTARITNIFPNGNITIATNGTGTLAMQTGNGGTINIGINAVSETINIGNNTGTTALNLNAGSGCINFVTPCMNFSYPGGAGQVQFIFNSPGGTFTGFKVPLVSPNLFLVLPTLSGLLGQVLTTNGAGVLSWTTPVAGAIPGGANGDVQFNNAGAFGGSANLFWNNGTNQLGIDTSSPSANLSFGGATATINNVTVNGAISILTNATGTLTLDSGTTGNVNLGTGANAKSISIGNNTVNTDLDISSGSGGVNFQTPSITLANTGSVTSLLFAGNAGGSVGFKAPATVVTPVNWQLPASDGTPSQILTTNGAGILTFTNPTGGTVTTGTNEAGGTAIFDSTNSTATTLFFKTLVAGTSITYTTAATTVTINNTGVTSAVAGTGIGVSSPTGAVTISNTGVTQILQGTNVTISPGGGTGNVTINAMASAVQLTSTTTANFAWTLGGTGAGSVTQTGQVSLYLELYSSATSSFVKFVFYNNTGAPGPNNVSGTTTSGNTLTFTATAVIPAPYRPQRQYDFQIPFLFEGAAPPNSANNTGMISFDSAGTIKIYKIDSVTDGGFIYAGILSSIVLPTGTGTFGIATGDALSGSWIVS